MGVLLKDLAWVVTVPLSIYTYLWIIQSGTTPEPV